MGPRLLRLAPVRWSGRVRRSGGQRCAPARALVAAVAGLVVVAGVVGCGSGAAETSGETTTTAAATQAASSQRPGAPTAEQVACAARLPQAVKVGQVINAVVEQPELTQATELVAAGTLGGVTVLGRPDGGLGPALAGLRSAGGAIPPMVATDEEGGRVQRLAGLLGALPPAAEQATRYSPEELTALAAEHAAKLRELGIDTDFAPVLDVGGAPGIGDRSYGDTPARVQAWGGAFARGLHDGGVLPVVKHFPGHGRASGDSHETLPTTPPVDDVRWRDLVPFTAVLERAASEGWPVAVMVGHLVVPGLTGDLPASLSPEAIDGLLRGELGFGGLVVTDALNMGAITARWNAAQAAEAALVAGADVALLGSLADVPGVATALGAAVDAGRLPAARLDEAVARVLVAKGLDPCALPSPGAGG